MNGYLQAVVSNHGDQPLDIQVFLGPVSTTLLCSLEKEKIALNSFTHIAYFEKSF